MPKNWLKTVPAHLSVSCHTLLLRFKALSGKRRFLWALGFLGLLLGSVFFFVDRQVTRDLNHYYAPERGTLLKVGFTTDWEYGTRKRLQHKLTNQAPVELQKVVDYFNNVYQPEIVIAGGDYIESSGVKPETAKAQLKYINTIFTHLQAPRVYALGNHDMRSLSKEDVESILGVSAGHAQVDIGDWRLVVVDTNFNKEDDSDRNTKAYVLGYVSQRELQWLDQALTTERPTVVFTHHSPVPTFNIENIQEENMSNAADFRAVLEKHPNVVASVAGHTPRPQAYAVNGIEYFVCDTLVNESGLGAFATLDLYYNAASRKAEMVFEHYGRNRQTYTASAWLGQPGHAAPVPRPSWWQSLKDAFRTLKT